LISEKGQLKEIIIYHPKGNNIISRRTKQAKAFESGMDLIENVDIIHAHVLLPFGHLFVKAKKRFSCPFILTEHGSYYRKNKSWNLKEKYVCRFAKNHIDKLIAVSDFLKNDMEAYFPGHDIQVIPNPINTELFKPAKKTSSEIKQFLHISTLDKEIKNPGGIIDAVDLLKTKGYSNFQLTILSDEPYVEWQKYSKSKGLTEFIQFDGPFQLENLVSFYQRSDAFILFSTYETFSIVLAEAWACGIPVISTPVGIAHNLSPELGLQVKSKDSLSLAMAMEKILLGVAFKEESIREYALNFSEQKVLEVLQTTYAQING
jgi:glycosyltransferase involved in cell wall biosynthesis